MVHYSFLLRLLEVLRLLHFTPAPLAAGVVTPLTSFPPPYQCHQWKRKKKNWEDTLTRSNRTWAVQTNLIQLLFARGKRQGQTAEFEINQTLGLSTAAMFRFQLWFDLGSSFQWVLTCLWVVRNPEPAAYSGGFSDTVFTRHEEVGALQQTAAYTALSIISHSIHENRSTAGRTVWTTKL